MSDEIPAKEDASIEPVSMTRAEKQAEASHNDSRKESHIDAQYHHNDLKDEKDVRDLIEARAAKERAEAVKLDPLELIRQVQKMRDEGFDEATIRAAFQEVMGELTGQFRRPMRRVLKSEGMSKMLTPSEMVSHYSKQVYGQKEGETDSAMDERIKLILERIEQTKDFKLEYKRPTLKQYLFRAALFVLRRPVNFLIRFLIAFRNAGQ